MTRSLLPRQSTSDCHSHFFKSTAIAVQHWDPISIAGGYLFFKWKLLDWNTSINQSFMKVASTRPDWFHHRRGSWTGNVGWFGVTTSSLSGDGPRLMSKVKNVKNVWWHSIDYSLWTGWNSIATRWVQLTKSITGPWFNCVKRKRK